MVKEGFVKVFDKRVGRIVCHKKKKWVVDHNKGRAYPEFEKVVEARDGENCVALALWSVLKALHAQNETETLKDVWELVIEDGQPENFHQIVLPSCENGKYNPEKGYNMTNLLYFVRTMSEKYFIPKGWYLECKSLRHFTPRSFFKMSSGQRCGRTFVLFGHYPSTEKNSILQKRLRKHMSSERTAYRVYDKPADAFWSPEREFSLHAIAIHYDGLGNGTIDDPAHTVYHPMTPVHFFRSCACICSVYEFSIVKRK